jgi:hypothetical protein
MSKSEKKVIGAASCEECSINDTLTPRERKMWCKECKEWREVNTKKAEQRNLGPIRLTQIRYY